MFDRLINTSPSKIKEFSLQTPPSSLEDLLLPTPLQSLPDVVVIGTQETNGERDEWEVGLQETLGPGHVLFHSVELGTIHLAVFLRRDLIWVCSGKTHIIKEFIDFYFIEDNSVNI